MIPASTAAAIAVIAFVVGLIVRNLIEFFWYVDSPDERDDIIERLKAGFTDVQQKLLNVKNYTHEVQIKYVDSERNNIDGQIKCEQVTRENKALKDENDELKAENAKLKGSS